MIDRHRPVIAGYVPVELGVTIIVVIVSDAVTPEEADAVAHRIINVDDARGVDRSGYIDFEIAVGPRFARIVFQLVPVLVGNAHDLEKERVVGSFGSGIFDGNGPMDAVPLADEGECDFFADQGGAVGGDRDSVLEIGDTPTAYLGMSSSGKKKQK